MSLFRSAAPAALMFLIATSTTMSATAQDRPAPRTVTVEATGSVAAEPDIAVISTGVIAEADTAREALNRNTAAMKRLVDGLKALGIEAADIQTSQLSVEPRTTQPKDGRAPTIAGYRVFNQVRITARQIDRLGEVLDQAVTLGANQIGGIEFQVSKAEALKDEARRQALANALRRAALFATGAGAELGAVLTIAEETGASGPRPFGGVRTMAAAVPIERGTQMLEAHVTVTWQLK